MARPISDGGSRNKKSSVGQQRMLRDIKKAAARKQLGTIKGIAGIVGGAVLEGIGGPKARGAKTVAKIVAKDSPRVIRAIAREAAGKAAKAPHGIYRKPSMGKLPRLREVDGKPKNVTVRQKVGPKTKSGKFTESKRKTPINTQPPARTKPAITPKEKFDPSKPVTYKRNLPANPRLAAVERNRRAKAIAEYKAVRDRQAKLATARAKKEKIDTAELRPAQPTIESRLTSGAEKLDITSRNASKLPQIDSTEFRKYAQLLRESKATKPNVTTSQINRGRARALMPDTERRAIEINAARNRAITKAKARGLTDTQISQMIANARKEAGAIARKASRPK